MTDVNSELLDQFRTDRYSQIGVPVVSLLKISTVLSVGVLAGLAASANAQSVSALPPTTPPSYTSMPPVQNAHTGVAGSTQSVYPKPGGGGLWGHYQLPAQSATGAYPGPKTN